MRKQRRYGALNPLCGSAHPNWTGGRTVSSGYVLVLCPEHPRAKKRYVHEHVLIVERVMGKPLRRGAEIHHVNEDGLDNRPDNLVVCQDKAYHSLLHRRMRALAACGDANARRCQYCKRYDAPANLRRTATPGRMPYHLECQRANEQERKARRRRSTQSIRGVLAAIGPSVP